MFEQEKKITTNLPILCLLMMLPLLSGFDIGESPAPSPDLPALTKGTHHAEFTGVDPEALAFQRQLAKAYFDLAAEESHSLPIASHFARKAIAIQSGRAAQPEYLNEWTLHPEQIKVLSQARLRLMDSLNTHKLNKAYRPTVDRKIQALANFDCWVANTEVTDNKPKAQHCRSQFEEALTALNNNKSTLNNNKKRRSTHAYPQTEDEFQVSFAFNP